MIKKGPYPFNEYKQQMHNLEKQLDKYEYRKLNALGGLWCIMLIAILYLTSLLLTFPPPSTFRILIVFGIVLAYCLIFVLPFIIKIFRLHWKIDNLRYEYRETSTPVSLIAIKDKIDVHGNKVTIAPLSNIDKCYYYINNVYRLEDNDTHEIFKLDENTFWEEYHLVTKGCGRHEITLEEYKLLKSKDL